MSLIIFLSFYFFACLLSSANALTDLASGHPVRGPPQTLSPPRIYSTSTALQYLRDRAGHQITFALNFLD